MVEFSINGLDRVYWSQGGWYLQYKGVLAWWVVHHTRAIDSTPVQCLYNIYSIVIISINILYINVKDILYSNDWDMVSGNGV